MYQTYKHLKFFASISTAMQYSISPFLYMSSGDDINTAVSLDYPAYKVNLDCI